MKKILIIEDDYVSVFLIKKIISRLGNLIPITDASNGETALEILSSYFETANSLPDFILLDLNMPVMDGFEFLRTFATLTIPGIEEVKIIVLSSSLKGTDIALAMQLGAYRFLPKPLEEKSLRDILHEIDENE